MNCCTISCNLLNKLFSRSSFSVYDFQVLHTLLKMLCECQKISILQKLCNFLKKKPISKFIHRILIYLNTILIKRKFEFITQFSQNIYILPNNLMMIPRLISILRVKTHFNHLLYQTILWRRQFQSTLINIIFK